ncbi:MAG TPA: hypothetical protein VJO13_21610, partial [Ktedonobacterales bacterium]|nr:hypothetical protein [Ktedonobacterales bacterium]
TLERGLPDLSRIRGCATAWLIPLHDRRSPMTHSQATGIPASPSLDLASLPAAWIVPDGASLPDMLAGG